MTSAQPLPAGVPATAATRGAPPQIGDIVAGRYQIEGKLGQGGNGVVHAARHLQSGQAVALKVLHEDANADAVRRFEREARLVGALHHPNTVRLLDFGVTASAEPFLAMELVRGQTLEQRLRALDAQDAVLSEAETTAIAVQTLRALQEAHALGLVHRDLKPANVMLCDAMDGEFHVKLLDFGIACTTDPAFAQSGAGLGTPAYMSPEQCEALPVDARADLYAVGVIAYRCLSGRLPFSDPDPLAVLRMHVLRPPPDLRSVARTPLTDAVANAVHRAMAKQPEQRFASAREMCEALTGRMPTEVVARPDLPAAGDATATQAAGQRPSRPKWLPRAIGALASVALGAGGWMLLGPSAPRATHAAVPLAPVPPAAFAPRTVVAPPMAAALAAPQPVAVAAPPVAAPPERSAAAAPKTAARVRVPAAPVGHAPVPTQPAAPTQPSAAPDPPPIQARQMEKMSVD